MFLYLQWEWKAQVTSPKFPTTNICTNTSTLIQLQLKFGNLVNDYMREIEVNFINEVETQINIDADLKQDNYL